MMPKHAVPTAARNAFEIRELLTPSSIVITSVLPLSCGT